MPTRSEAKATELEAADASHAMRLTSRTRADWKASERVIRSDWLIYIRIGEGTQVLAPAAADHAELVKDWFRRWVVENNQHALARNKASREACALPDHYDVHIINKERAHRANRARAVLAGGATNLPWQTCGGWKP